MSDMTLAEAAKAVGKSAVTLRAAVNQGKLQAYQKGRVHMVSLNDVVALFAQRSASDGRAGASVQKPTADEANQAIVTALQSQVRALENERDFLRQLLMSERDSRMKVESDMSAVLMEIRAFMSGNQSGLLTRFFKK